MHEGAEAPKKEKKRNRKEMQNDGQVVVLVAFFGGFGGLFGSVLLVVWIVFPDMHQL